MLQHAAAGTPLLAVQCYHYSSSCAASSSRSQQAYVHASLQDCQQLVADHSSASCMMYSSSSSSSSSPVVTGRHQQRQAGTQACTHQNAPTSMHRGMQAMQSLPCTSAAGCRMPRRDARPTPHH
jgi:hypothetical protein